MTGRSQSSTRAAWRTTRLAALCPALTVLLTLLVICLGTGTHAAADPAAGPMTSMSATTVTPADPSAKVAAHPADCPDDDMCCHAAAQGVHAVLAAPVHPLPVLLPRLPDLPGPPDGTPRRAEPPPTTGAPDLHVLQVQRT
jgi:hypothetical protein